MLPRTHIMLHHSLTRDNQTVSWGAIRRYHVEERGFRAIGYHYGVELVGDHYEVILGRSELDPAAACPQEQMNARALHICCVGNFDEAPPPAPMLEAVVGLVILPAMVEYGIPPERLIGHRDINPAKSCPGTRFDLEVVRRMSLESMGTLAGVERWHHTEGAGRGPLAALRRRAPGRPSQKDLAARLERPVAAVAQLEAGDTLPWDDLVPEYARALAVPEHEVLEAFAVATLDFHRQRLAEASARVGALQGKSRKRPPRAA
ncbi:MAG: N-acetylmuramoyl-L-alanine amidase [Candidatus Eiseniibacteriota bacterium]